ncbi:MAG: hypothetical protein Q7J43_02215 [Pseudomonas sp.]|uniref:DUF6671 family protein n=1 Tax=Pseudomonas sp. TaxID=306 RepID=UPI002718C870|nr:DUF6671 family protein [Pseudomonas sp.]MDO9616479.1 hypothetical protein [Pseudomonas sp.]MDP2445625.1 hypothetical protein [Pseudomonas sp.]MDZ4338113.1 DUF6671 family protein [Pseudomonas sp.]
MSAATPYNGVHSLLPARNRVSFLTCHDKTRLVSEPLDALGFALEPLAIYDTDHFGTFSREVSRTGTAKDTVLAKAKLAAELAGLRFGLGSEGSFAKDPHIGWMPWDYELLCLWDNERQYAVFALAGSGATNYSHCEIEDIDAAVKFMDKALFPEHALILGKPGDAWFRKGIRDRDWLIDQLHWLLSSPKRIWLETDMRAHLNPMRQAVIREAGVELAKRLSSRCPECAAMGFAVVRSEPGLVCMDCGISTPLASAHTWECPACAHIERRPVTTKAPAINCEFCNP